MTDDAMDGLVASAKSASSLWEEYAGAEKCPTFSRGDSRYWAALYVKLADAIDALRSPPADVGEAARAAYNAYEEAGMYPECSPRWEDIGSRQEHWQLAVRAALRALAETKEPGDRGDGA